MTEGETQLRVRHRLGSRGPRGRVALLSRYILTETAAPALLALTLIAFVMVGSELREQSEALPLQFIASWDIARLLVYFLPPMVPYLIAVAYMTGILMAFGRLSQNSEIIAMQAAGIPLKRLVMPVIAGGALLGVCAFVIQDRVQPAALKSANNLIYNELPNRITLEILPTGVMHPLGDLRVYIGSRDPETKTLHNLHIYQPTDDGRDMAYYASTAQFRREGGASSIFIESGHLVPASGESVTRIILNDFTLPLPIPEKVRPPSLRKTMSLSQLLEQENTEGKTLDKKDLRKLRVEIAERCALPFAALAVSFVAAPLAVRSRRSGRSRGFAMGFVLILGYYLLRMVFEPDSLKSLSETIVRAMVPNIILGAAGVWALWRVDRI